MVGSFDKLAAAAALCIIAAGCATTPPPLYTDTGRTEPITPLQCVPYAREHTHIALYGDAYTWWDQAAGRYERSSVPSEGAVMVLYGYSGSQRAHLAVVTRIVSGREIRVDHANWLDDGAVYTSDPVRDVSEANDWSQVRVFNVRSGSWGVRVYPVQGFIEPRPDSNAMELAGGPSAGGSSAGSPSDDDPPDDSADDPRKDDPIGRLLANDPLLSDGNNLGKPTR